MAENQCATHPKIRSIGNFEVKLKGREGTGQKLSLCRRCVDTYTASGYSVIPVEQQLTQPLIARAASSVARALPKGEQQFWWEKEND